ncbi:hypothetical protein, partial [Salmonella sp. s58078]|uniref:hypothetical protein n=1 Tax=Salmonella sp. s58078 TaxID=3159699 RepID=UPI00398141C7
MATKSLSVLLHLLIACAAAGVSSASTFSDDNPIRTVVSEIESSVVDVLGRSRHALSFARFAHRYGKSYESVELMKLRFATYSENLKMIASHNRKGLPYTLGVNQFADLTWEEFRKHRLGAAQNCSATTKGSHKITAEVLPELKDWRE